MTPHPTTNIHPWVGNTEAVPVLVEKEETNIGQAINCPCDVSQGARRSKNRPSQNREGRVQVRALYAEETANSVAR